jgi:hypothetical protein
MNRVSLFDLLWILIEIINLRYVGVSLRFRFGIVGIEGVNWRFIVGSFWFVIVVDVD